MIKNFSTMKSKVFTIYSLGAFVIFFLLLSFLSIHQEDANEDNHLPLSTVISNDLQKVIAPLKNLLHEIEVAEGHTFINILKDHNIHGNDILKIINAVSEVYDPTKLVIGQKFTFQYDQHSIDTEPKVQSIVINIAADKNIEITRKKGDEFTARSIVIPLKKNLTHTSGIIANNFIDTAINIGAPYNALVEIIKAFSYEVDFQRDIQNGHKIDLVYERFYHKNGDNAYDGNITFASLQLGDRKINIYRYINSNDEVDYYSDDGHSVKKELLRTPINVARISSSYGMRKHPIKGYSTMHKGIDFAASIGTPIFAAGHGVITEIRHKGTYGNYVRIKHNNQISTAYAHTSRFAKGLKKGDKVKQGDVIAYVGTTGRSTGPHLHYETLVNNEQVNPLSMKMSPGHKLSSKELSKFQQYKTEIDKIVADSE